MSTIIKATASGGAPPGTAFNFADVTDKARRYLDEVRGQAAQILDEARREADEIRRRAHDEGQAAARHRAEAEVDERIARQLGTVLPALGAAVDEIGHVRQSWLRQWEKSAVQLATAIAARVIRRQVARQPQITLTLIREALELAAGSPQIVLRLHPDDVAALGGQVTRLVAELTRSSGAEVVSDEHIERGSCKVETRQGTIDQQFSAQLARIEEELA